MFTLTHKAPLVPNVSKRRARARLSANYSELVSHTCVAPRTARLCIGFHQAKLCLSREKLQAKFNLIYCLSIFIILAHCWSSLIVQSAQAASSQTAQSAPAQDNESQPSNNAACFGGLQTFEKISMSSFENPSGSSGSGAFGSGILIQQDDQALTSECVNLCRSQSNCLSFVIDYNKFECKSYATTQQELQQEFEAKTARSVNSSTLNVTDGYQSSASDLFIQQLLPSASSNYFEKICLDGVANRNQFNDKCGNGRLWTVERVVDSFLDGYVEKEVTNVNNKDECSKLCIFETQFVCRSADYETHSRLCRLSKEDRRTQPQAMRHLPGSNRHYLENQCATPGPSSCIYETKRNLGIISMDALKFAQTVQDCQSKCNQESTFNCRSYSYHQQRCFLSGDDSHSLNSNLIKLPVKQNWQFGEKKCQVELCTKGMFSYEKTTGYTLRSALSTPIDLMAPSGSTLSLSIARNTPDPVERMQLEASQARLRNLLPRALNDTSSIVSAMMMTAANSDPNQTPDPMYEAASGSRNYRSASNLAITNNCRHSCDLAYLNCPAFTIDYKNNRCQRLDRNSQGRHHELVAQDGFAYFEKICLRVPAIMSMCQDKYWIFERVIGYELAPRFYEKSLKFVQSRRDCEEYCLEEKQFQCRSALYNDENSECKLSKIDRRLAAQDGGYYKNFNARISYLENQCVRDHSLDKELQCSYEKVRDESVYPTYTEHIEVAQSTSLANLETESTRISTSSASTRQGSAFCEQLCNDNSRFECHSFGYYASTSQCFLSGDDSISAGDLAMTPSTGFVYYEKRCRQRISMTAGNQTFSYDTPKSTTTEDYSHSNDHSLNPYLIAPNHISPSSPGYSQHDTEIDYSNGTYDKPPLKVAPSLKPNLEVMNDTLNDANQYKCGLGHSFAYQRIPGFEPIGGFLTLLIKNNETPGIVAECAELCKRAYECRAFIVDYGSNQCFAMLENSSVGMLSLRQTLGKDYFEGFCIADHILTAGIGCRSRTWVMDKIVDQAVVGVQHQKLIQDSDRLQCRQACLEERLFQCKSAMFDSSTGECRLYSVDRESIPQMRLSFTKGADFFENQCHIMSNSCPYDAIERDMSIVTVTSSVQAKSTFDCEHACNIEMSFNCRSYTYLDKYPSLPNLCLLSSDSRSTSQRGAIKEHSRTLYAERNCFYRRARYPGNSISGPEPLQTNSPQNEQRTTSTDPYRNSLTPSISSSSSPSSNAVQILNNESYFNTESMVAIGQGCESHQYTFERSFGYDFRFGQKERAPIPPTIGIAIGCQQECLKRADKCRAFVVEYSLPYQSCFLMDSSVGSNKRLLIKSPNSAYFEKVCLPKIGIEPESSSLNSYLTSAQHDATDISPSYSSEPWSPKVPTELPYYLQQQRLALNYPSRSCAKLWSFERFINHNFTAPSDKLIENAPTKAHCESYCINEAGFNCRAATYDYNTLVCRLFKNTRRTIMSQFINLENPNLVNSPSAQNSSSAEFSPGSAHVIPSEIETIQGSHSNMVSTVTNSSGRSQGSARQLSSLEISGKNIDYFENTCQPEPSSCQYRQLYDQLSPYIDKINHAVSLSDCQRQCDLERLFSCKSINYDPSSKNCMLMNEDLISLDRGQQGSLIPKKNTIYSEKGNCEMISVQCNSQQMLVNINFDSPFRGRILAKGNPEQCHLVGDGQTSIQFPIVFGPKCNSRQEGHNTFVNEVVIQQHPVIMTESDKTVRVMCAFEAPEQTITLKSPSARDNKTGIDVGAPEISRTRHDKQSFNSVVSNKAPPPSVLLRILDLNGRDASMISLGDSLMLKIQMQLDGQNSALGIFARNLAARSSNGESLLLIDNEGCPVDPQVFPALSVDPKDGRSLQSTFKAFRFPSSGLVNFEVQIRFCPELCQPVDCTKSPRTRSYGRRKRSVGDVTIYDERTSVIQSVNPGHSPRVPIIAPSTVMKPGKAFQYVRQLFLNPLPNSEQTNGESTLVDNKEEGVTTSPNEAEMSTAQQENQVSTTATFEIAGTLDDPTPYSEMPGRKEPNDGPLNSEFMVNNAAVQSDVTAATASVDANSAEEEHQPSFQKSILMHVDEKIVPSSVQSNLKVSSQHQSQAPYGRFPDIGVNLGQVDTSGRLFNGGQSMNHVDNQVGISSESSTSSNLDHSTSDNIPSTPGPDEMSQTGSSGSELTSEHTTSSLSQQSQKELPLRFSILVGENQPKANDWLPGTAAPVLVMNSSRVELDDVVVPGKESQLEQLAPNDLASRFNLDTEKTTIPTQSLNSGDSSRSDSRTPISAHLDSKKKISIYEQTFDALPSNSIAAEVRVGHSSAKHDRANVTHKIRQIPSTAETAASHDCHLESNSNRLWTIIWTGTIVIALNVCLVIFSLFLYFRKVHLRQNHTISHTSSDYGTDTTSRRTRWPSVLLKSKNSLGTSLNTHEHFFCKLNSKSNISGNTGGIGEFNWPNLSSSSAHSTISSLASPLPVTSIRINQSRLHRPSFEHHSGLTNHKVTVDSYETSSSKLRGSYSNNIDESRPDAFPGI